MDKYLIILPFSEKEIIIECESIDSELTDGRTFFTNESGLDRVLKAVAPSTAMIIKLD